MRRAFRHLSTILSALSLLLCAARDSRSSLTRHEAGRGYMFFQPLEPPHRFTAAELNTYKSPPPEFAFAGFRIQRSFRAIPDRVRPHLHDPLLVHRHHVRRHPLPLAAHETPRTPSRPPRTPVESQGVPRLRLRPPHSPEHARNAELRRRTISASMKRHGASEVQGEESTAK